MADSKDRSGHPTPQSTGSGSGSVGSGGGGGGGGGIPSRFLSHRIWGRASATTKTSTGNDETLSARSISTPNLTPSSTAASATTSTTAATVAAGGLPRRGTAGWEALADAERVASQASAQAQPTRAFHLDEAIRLIDPGGVDFSAISAPEMVQLVNATAVFLRNVVDDKGDVFAPPGEGEGEGVERVKPGDIKQLWAHATTFADRKTEPDIRIAGLRLVASLLVACPPPRLLSEVSEHGVADADPARAALPSSITARTVYGMIIAPTEGGVPPEKKAEMLFVQVEALRALTKGGKEVEGLAGIVGWLVRMLKEFKGDWETWCARKGPQKDALPGLWSIVRVLPFNPLSPIGPADSATAIITLLHGILADSIALFDPSKDIPRIVTPLFSFVARGFAGSYAHSPEHDVFSVSRRNSGPSSTIHTPSPHSASPVPPAAVESSLRRAVSGPRPKRDTAMGTPNSKARPPLPTTNTTRKRGMPPAEQLPKPPSFYPQFTSLWDPYTQDRWAVVLPYVCSFLEIFIDQTVISRELFVEIMRFVCIVLVYDDEVREEEGNGAVFKLLAVMMKSNSGRRGEQALRVIMEGQLADSSVYDGFMEVDCKAVLGAIFITRSLLLHLDDPTPTSSLPNIPTASLSSLAPSLVSATSTSRFADPEKRVRWEPVDYAVLHMLQVYCQQMRMGTGKFDAKSLKGDVWTEGHAACSILVALKPIALPTLSGGYSLGLEEEQSTFSVLYNDVVRLVPLALKQLIEPNKGQDRFQHPEYIQLLFSFDNLLTEDDAAVIIDYYRESNLCMPVAKSWVENIWKLIDFFYNSSVFLPKAKRSLASLLFDHIYVQTEQLPQARGTVVSQVIVPFLEKSLSRETDDAFRQGALDVMVKAAVMETFERDEERRKARSEKKASEVEEEDASALPSQEVKDAAAGGSFHAIRGLIMTLASTAWCKEDEGQQVSQRVPEPRRPLPLARDSSTVGGGNGGTGGNGNGAAGGSSAGSGLKGLMSALSPPSRTKELPSLTPTISSGEETPLPIGRPAPPSQPTHTECHSLLAVRALITIFNQLAFSPPHSFSSSAKAARTPASSRCITIYRDLLGLLYPMAEHVQGDSTPTSRVAVTQARCPKARVTILQWLFRLRADPKHRIYLRTNIDHVIRPFAETLFRTKEAVEAQRAKVAADAEEAGQRARSRQMASGPRENVRDRASAAATTRSRSRSRPPAPVERVGLGAEPSDTFNPLWSVPETLAFDMPGDSLPSEGLLTYDPNHPSLREADAPPVEGVWLPVSEYVRALNGILHHETNWEVVAYVLCFLPLQLSNKLFFRGGRATSEVKKLLGSLCKLLPQSPMSSRVERRCKYGAYIKRPNVNAAIYQALSILISYRDVLAKEDCDDLIAAFELCLESNTVVAKPCIQALTLCIFELEQPIGKRLLPIIGKLRDINFTSGIAVHLLEFILALGQHQVLFRNFTDAHYKDVFTLVIDFIAEHNARSDESPDLTADVARENYTLSQHVIGLAYHAIYVWFIALKLTLRPDLVQHIISKLLQSRSKRVAVDEMVEVCFDWLARYTYSNADPKPASSFLSEMVMADPREGEEPKRQSWFLGGAIITIAAHPRSGWTRITSTRPTGATEVIAKVENVPLLAPGEANADLSSLPAALMANRTPKEGEEETVKDIVRHKSEIPETEDFDQSSQHGFIWSGATPSQRRKDVAIDPAYIGIELLSAYPSEKLDAPRGRLIPNDERFLRSLRTIEHTPVIDTAKLGVLYVGPGQTNETEILGNIDGSSLYLDFLAGLGRLIRLKGQVDVFTGGLNREDDSDGEYAYAWWDDLIQTIFHTATMMPNRPHDPSFSAKKRHIGNDYVKIIYNDSGRDFRFDTLTTAFNFINIVISPHTTPESRGPTPYTAGDPGAGTGGANTDGWAVWARDDYFKVIVQRAPGIPEFGPVGELRIVSRETLPVFVRHVALMANDLAARYAHIRNARDPAEAEYITSWRSRLRAMNRLKAALPPVEPLDDSDELKREEMLRE
ncbi:hypothetical protein IAT38_007751 [Cryptococcus sp. DSM 104549]